MTGSHPSVHGGASSEDSLLTLILLLPLLCDRADNDLLLLVGPSSVIVIGDVDLTNEVLALLSKSLNCSKSENHAFLLLMLLLVVLRLLLSM